MISPRFAGIVDEFPGVDVASLLQEVLFRIADKWKRDAETAVMRNVCKEFRLLEEETTTQFVVERRGWCPVPSCG